MSCDAVIRAFGADPADPLDMADDDGSQPVVLVAPIGDAILAVEPNGYQGTSLLAVLSVNGTAASMYWNVNAVTSLGFARQGSVLAQFEPCGTEDVGEPEVTAALAGLDFTDYRHMYAKGVTAVARFAGHDFRAADVDEMLATNAAYLPANRWA